MDCIYVFSTHLSYIQFHLVPIYIALLMRYIFLLFHPLQRLAALYIAVVEARYVRSLAAEFTWLLRVFLLSGVL
jgi:hypothetical protein